MLRLFRSFFVRSKPLSFLTIFFLGVLILTPFLLAKEVKASASSTDYSTAGTYNFTVPGGVNSIIIELWGGGGAGGKGGSTNRYGGGGGAGGAYSKKTLAVTPATVYSVVVGAGGAVTGTNGNPGADTTFNSTTAVAKGGAGGLSYTNGKTGGAGSTTGCVGDTVYAGGTGATGATTYSGGGGSGAGSTGTGNSGSAYTGGAVKANNGGKGGNGSSANTGIGLPGGLYAGGGGGSTKTANAGAGSTGYILISYTVPTYTLTYTAGTGGVLAGVASQSVDYGSDGTQVTAFAYTGYTFSQWSDGVMTDSRTDLNVIADKSVTAQFTINTYTLTYTAGASGSITGTSPQTVNYNDNGTQVTAVPDSGYIFSQWSDGILTAARTDTAIAADLSVTAQFIPSSYTLTYSAGAGGTISGPSPQTINYGNDGTQVTAVSNTGYSFIQWSDGIMTAARTDTNVTGNKSVTAQFTINTYTLTYTPGAGGTITGTSPQSVLYNNNGTQVTAVPNTGYHFVQWSDSVMTAARTDLNVSANQSVTAQFAINTYTLSYTAGAGGTLTGTASQVVNHGSNGTQITAVPNTGYHFVQWSDSVMTAARTDLNVTADKSVTAQFAINTYTLTYTAGSGGTLTGTASQVVNYNTNGTQVTAVPNTGYTFSQWSDGVMTAARTDLNVTANKSVTAQFTINTYTLTYAAGAGGTLTGTASQVVNYNTNGTQVTAVPNTGYSFIQWSDGVMTAARTDTNVTGNKSVTAQFTINTYTLTYTPGAGGTISGTSPQSVLYNNNGTQVTAVPNTGYHFVQWSDSIMTAARTDLNVAANKTVTAQFAINTYTLTYAAGAGGTLTGTASQVVNYNNNGTQVTAVPNTGYTFSQWSDGVMTAARTDLNVIANKSVTAQFTINTYTLTYAAGAGGTLSGTTSQNVNHGSNGTQVTAVPNTGYSFIQWSDGVMTAARTDTNVTGNKSVTAQFTINTYTLTYNPGTGGTISGTSPQSVLYNNNGTQVTAVANTGYTFSQWSDGILTAARTDLNIAANKTVTAQFTINTYTLTYTPGTGGTISGTASQVVNYNSNGSQVTAVPDTGYHFVQWSDGVMTAARTDLNVAANKLATAQFAINAYTLTYLFGAGGSVSGTTPQNIDHGSNGTQVTAVPSTGYSFIQWSDGVLTAARTDTNVTTSKSVTAQFTINTYSVNYVAGSGGTISGNTSQNIMHGNGGSPVTAVADTGYHFVQWSDGNSSVSRSEANIVSNLSIVAQFALDDPGGSTTGAKILKNSANKMVVGSLQQGLVLDLPLRNKYTKSSTVGSEILTDRTPYSNDGQNYGAALGASGLTFNGLGDYVKIPIQASLQPQSNLTLSAWVKPNASFSGDVIILGQGAYYLTVAADWSVQVYWYGKNPEGYHATAAGAVTPGAWNLITAVWSNTDVKIYVNGVLKTTVACTGTGGQAINQVWIGAENNGTARRFRGDISGVLIYNQVVSGSDINLLYARGLVDASAIIH